MAVIRVSCTGTRSDPKTCFIYDFNKWWTWAGAALCWHAHLSCPGTRYMLQWWNIFQSSLVILHDHQSKISGLVKLLNPTIPFARSGYWRDIVTAVVPEALTSLCHHLPGDVSDGDSRSRPSSVWCSQHHCLYQGWQGSGVFSCVWTPDYCELRLCLVKIRHILFISSQLVSSDISVLLRAEYAMFLAGMSRNLHGFSL